MAQGSRTARVADQIRSEIASMLARDVHDPGIGFVTITRVAVSADLQHARISYTALGDEKDRRNTSRALGRAAPFLRRQIGSRLRLKRVPELEFAYDESIAGQDRIEQLLNEIRAGDHPADDDRPHTDTDDETS
jgi:ribosome-binding factor A